LDTTYTAGTCFVTFDWTSQCNKLHEIHAFIKPFELMKMKMVAQG